MKLLRHDHVDLIRFDVEGLEWEMLPALLRSPAFYKVRQVTFEAHFWTRVGEPEGGTRAVAGGGHTAARMYGWIAMLRELRQAGFRLFAAKPNPLSTDELLSGDGAARPCCYQLGYVRALPKSDVDSAA